MSCFICNKNDFPWLVLKNDNIHRDINGKNIGDKIQTCSYICTRKCDKFLPNNYSHLVLNKEDFCYLRPITKIPKKEFNLLSFDEINKMSEDEKEYYYLQVNNKLELNTEILEIYREIEMEDKYTYNIENYYNSSDSEYNIDDY